MPVAAVISTILAISGRDGAKFITKIKRTTEVEYSGWLLPGYGGILDRMGSLDVEPRNSLSSWWRSR